jgi:hypothetical protein
MTFEDRYLLFVLMVQRNCHEQSRHQTVGHPAIIYSDILTVTVFCHCNAGGSSIPHPTAVTAIQFQRALPGGSTDKPTLRIFVKSTCR